MPKSVGNPLGLQVYNPVLTNVARQYRAHGFIYDNLVAKQSVSTLSFQYPVFTKQDWFSAATDNETKDRAPAKEVDFSFATESATAKEYALKVSITDLERQQAIPQLRLEQNKTEFLSLQMALSRELRLATILDDPAQTTGGGLTSGNSTAVSVGWDTSTSNPEADVRAAALNIYNTIGYQPNVIVIPFPVAYNLATVHGTDTFRNQIIYTHDVRGDLAASPDSILPPSLWGMKVIIPMGSRNTTANEGASSATYNEIWGKKVRLLYVDGGATWGTPSVCYAFQHTPPEVFSYRQNDPDIQFIRQRERVIEQVVAPDAGWVLRTVIA